MNAVSNIKLSVLPNLEESMIITTNSDGSPCSNVFSEKWDFSGQAELSVLSKGIVSFAEVDKSYRKYIQSTLAYLMQDQREKAKKNTTWTQVIGWKQGLVNIRKAMISSDWASLSDEKTYKGFEVRLKRLVQEKNLSKGVCGEVVTALNKLNQAKLCLCVVDGLKIRGFSNKEIKQHIAIPIGMYQPIIAKALEVVELYHPHRETINSAHQQLEGIIQGEENSSFSQKAKSIEGRVRRKAGLIPHNVPGFEVRRDGRDLNRIMKACTVVILAFSGMRIGEMASLSKSSYIEKGQSNIPTLQGKESKRNGRPITETWQTHSVAKVALELAHDMTQHLRDNYTEINNQALRDGDISRDKHRKFSSQINSAFLTMRTDVRSTSYVITNFSNMLNDFFRDSGIVATEADVEEFDRLNPSRMGQLKVGGVLPKFSPHDFRRSFAVFFKRYGFGSSASIKFQFKHTNINMSDYYGNNARLQAMEDVLLDNELLEIMNEEGIRMGVDIFDDIYNGSENLSGAAGERIAEDKFEKLSSGEHVYMTREEIELLVRNGTLSAVKLPTGGYCLNSTCSRVCGIGQFSAEKKPCEHQVVTDKEAKVILRQNKRLIQTFKSLNAGDPMMNSILIATKQKIQLNEQLIKNHNLQFEEFNDKVKGVIDTEEI